MIITKNLDVDKAIDVAIRYAVKQHKIEDNEKNKIVTKETLYKYIRTGFSIYVTYNEVSPLYVSFIENVLAPVMMFVDGVLHTPILGKLLLSPSLEQGYCHTDMFNDSGIMIGSDYLVHVNNCIADITLLYDCYVCIITLDDEHKQKSLTRSRPLQNITVYLNSNCIKVMGYLTLRKVFIVFNMLSINIDDKSNRYMMMMVNGILYFLLDTSHLSDLNKHHTTIKQTYEELEEEYPDIKSKHRYSDIELDQRHSASMLMKKYKSIILSVDNDLIVPNKDNDLIVPNINPQELYGKPEELYGKPEESIFRAKDNIFRTKKSKNDKHNRGYVTDEENGYSTSDNDNRSIKSSKSLNYLSRNKSNSNKYTNQKSKNKPREQSQRHEPKMVDIFNYMFGRSN